MSIMSPRADRSWSAAEPAPRRSQGTTYLSDGALWQMAYHEAGHALLGMLERQADAPLMASLSPAARAYAPAAPDAERERRLPGELYRRGRIIGLLGGLAAECVIYGDHLVTDESDLDDAMDAARELTLALAGQDAHQSFSMLVPAIADAETMPIHPDRAGSTEELIEREAERIIEESLEYAIAVLESHRQQLVSLAGALRTGETLDTDDILDATTRTLSLVPDQEPAVAEAPALEFAPVRHTSVNVLTRLALARYWGLTAVWAVVTVAFWGWWLGHSSHATGWLYWLQTTMLFYQTTLLPTIYWGFVRNMKRPVELKPASGLRVALITPCVPAHESTEVIRQQLDALMAVDYPHDSWILDEGNSPEVRALAEERGVKYFSRRGVGLWNQPRPPFQRATKAGNVNAWLDHVALLGLEYDAFVQLDIDHRPRPDYLERTLGYFRDPSVAWIQAPSVCGNLDNWAARGLTEQDLVFHGPLQMGFYGTSRTPFIIGSHTSYRTSAIREIGGFQPTRAEDHLDTVVLAANGYEGVFVPDLIAVGDGPDCLGTYLRQQFAWAYSMIQIFFHHTPRLVRRYSPRQAFQFLFCQSWYTMWSVSLALLWVLPTVALLIHKPIATVKIADFLVYFIPVMLVSSLMWCETRRWFQPANVKLSWRGIVLGVARWPVVLWALLNVIFRVKRPYMITPKGGKRQAGNGAVLYGPGLALAGVPLLALWVFHLTGGAGGIRGYYGLALLNAAMGLAVVAATVGAEFTALSRDAGLGAALRTRAAVMFSTVALTGLLVFSTMTVWAPMVGTLS